MHCNVFTFPHYKLPRHRPLLSCHLFPALVGTVQAPIASLASFLFFSAACNVCSSSGVLSNDLFLTPILTFCAKGIRALALLVLLCSQLPNMSGGFSSLSHPWSDLYPKIAAPCSDFQWPHIVFNFPDKGSNIILLSSLYWPICTCYQNKTRLLTLQRPVLAKWEL